MSTLPLRIILLAGLTALLATGCSIAQGPGAPIQDRTVIGDDGQLGSNPGGGGAGATVTPYSKTGPSGTQRPPDQIIAPPIVQAPPPNNAVIALLGSAGEQTRSGNLDSAAASLERALRIEPRNPEIWHRLAAVRLQQGQYDQAISLATKSSNLAGNNPDLLARNNQIIAQARQHQTKRG